MKIKELLKFLEDKNPESLIFTLGFDHNMQDFSIMPSTARKEGREYYECYENDEGAQKVWVIE